MVEFEISDPDGEDGICKRIMSEFHTELEEMFNMQEENGTEYGVGVGYSDDDIVISDFEKGDDGHIRRVDELHAMAFLPNEYNKISIHTHPTGESYFNMVLSPNDVITMLVNMDKVKNYTGATVVTKNDGELVLFGIHTENPPNNPGDIQDRLSDKKRRIELLSESGMNAEYLREIANIQDIAMEIGNPCKVYRGEI